METFKTLLINTKQLKQLLGNLIMLDTVLFQTFFIKFYLKFSIQVSKSSSGPSLFCSINTKAL